ncbi:MAG: hypothetical protein PHS97_00870 [Oscillospiraceae bacterium]|nr:hypothetical protein [Oscillospiraceae bacterium]
MRNTAILILLGLAMLVGVVLLQIFLSKRKSKWLGLILPMLSAAYSLLMVLNIAAFQAMTGGELLLLVGSVLLIGNLPTLVLLAIYFGCRQKRRAPLEKMNMQDLH